MQTIAYFFFFVNQIKKIDNSIFNTTYKKTAVNYIYKAILSIALFSLSSANCKVFLGQATFIR